MPRNIECDNREAQRRKNQLMEAGFRLFSRYGIEAVSLQKVADAANVGVATMYKYLVWCAGGASLIYCYYDWKGRSCL